MNNLIDYIVFVTFSKNIILELSHCLQKHTQTQDPDVHERQLSWLVLCTYCNGDKPIGGWSVHIPVSLTVDPQWKSAIC